MSVQIDCTVALRPPTIDVTLLPSSKIDVALFASEQIEVNYGHRGIAGPEGPTAVSTDPGNAARLGTDGLLFVPPGGTPGPHAPTHVSPGGSDPIPVATPARTGLMPALTGSAGTYLDAGGTWSKPPSGTGDMAKADYDTLSPNPTQSVRNATQVGGHATPPSGDASSAQVVLGNDTRLSNPRVPLVHAASTHGLGQSDPVMPDWTQVQNKPATFAATPHAASHGLAQPDAVSLDHTQVVGLGTAAVRDVPATGDAGGSQVVLGTDTRLTNNRAPSLHAASHLTGGGDTIATATPTATGLCPPVPPALTNAGASTPRQVVMGDDTRLSDSRVPSAHRTSHQAGGSDAVPLDLLGSASDITTLNASTAAHGLLRKLSGSGAQFLDGTGNWSTPAGGGGGDMLKSVYDANGNNIVDNTEAVLGHAPPASGDAAAAQVVLGNDSRLVNARAPTAHASTHNFGGSDVVTPDWTSVQNKPTTFAPAIHGSTHLTGGADPIPVAGPSTSGIVPGKPNAGVNSTGATQVVMGDDTRLTNTRVPTAHASTHNLGGSDVIAPDWTQVANKPATFPPDATAELVARKNAASGYAGLDSGSKLNPNQIPIDTTLHVTGGLLGGVAAVSTNANNKAALGSDSLVLVQGTATGVAATTHAQTVSGDDPQLTNSRNPLAHANTHVTTDLIPGATATLPGLVPARTGAAGTYLDVTGGWSTPPGTGGGANARPVVLGEIAADPVFTAGIIVPRYAYHPDQIWTYGAFDDHFDNPVSGAPNAKWVQSVTTGMLNQVFTQAGSKFCLGGASPAPNNTTYQILATQNLPAQATHQISFKAEPFFFSTAQTALSTSWLFINLAYGANAGGVSIQPAGQQVNTNAQGTIYIGSGAAYGGTVTANFVVTVVPQYYRITYDASKNTTIEISGDGIAWFTIGIATAAQSGFATNNPAQFVIGIAAWQNSRAFAQIDWVKHV